MPHKSMRSSSPLMGRSSPPSSNEQAAATSARSFERSSSSMSSASCAAPSVCSASTSSTHSTSQHVPDQQQAAILPAKSHPGQYYAATTASSWRASLLRIVAVVGILAVAGTHCWDKYTTRLDRAELMHDELLQDQEQLLNRLHQEQQVLSHKLQQLQDEKLHLQRTLELTQSQQVPLQSALLRQQQQVQQAQAANVAMQVSMASMFRQLAIEEFGRGPYFVEFQVQIWEDDGKPRTAYFTIELLSLSNDGNVPAHAVYAFLQQVRHGLWDGTSFYVNNNAYGLGARPVSGNGQVSRRADFDASPVSNLVFTNNRPNAAVTAVVVAAAKYDVLFHGLGPNFHVQTTHNNNNNAHQEQHHSVFGRVMLGRSTIDRMQAVPINDDGRIQPIDIVQARLVTRLNDKAQELYEQVLREDAAAVITR